MRRRIDQLDAELDKQRQDSKRLQAEFDALRNDPKTVERLARQSLGYAKTDETVIHFEASVTNPPGR
jgi:cell division protein FtsB